MKIKTVSDDLYTFIMRDIVGARFEQFAKRVFAAVFGENFIPLGGIHDGGADGVISSYVQEVSGKPNTFIQFSATDADGAKKKIKDTILALRKAGRDPRTVIYGTSEAIPKADIIINELHDEFSVLTQIRDVERIKHYVNSHEGANFAFYESFADKIDSLAKAANLDLPVKSQYALDPTVYVFLNHELRDRFSKDKLNDKVLDALIYWALRETDPDKNILVTRSALAQTIQEKFATAKTILMPRMKDRLAELCKKRAGEAERVRYYPKTDSFCLPFEMRQSLAREAASIVVRQEKFKDSLRTRIKDIREAFNGKVLDACIELVFSTIHRYFIDQGIILAAFLEKHLERIHISDQIVEDEMAKSLANIANGGSVTPEAFGTCLAVARGIFYNATSEEREYLAYLARTSCLLVTLQSAPKLLEYLNQMGGNFKLLVGTDLLVKALSENYLQDEQKQVTNLLLAAKKLGSQLILTEPVLEEVFTHLRAAHLEFENHYATQEQYLKSDDIAECDRILIRAYFHARRLKNGPMTWGAFVNQFADPVGLRSRSAGARTGLKGFLVQRFGMQYMSTDDLKATVSNERVNALAQTLEEARGIDKHQDLSQNDALMVYATYAQRRINHEEGIYDGFGYRTWWLTKETHIVRMTGSLVQSEGGIPYVMRPEFLLNFITLAPKAATVRESFSEFLPTTAGLQLGQYLDGDVMHSLLKDVNEWSQLPPERISVLLGEKVNKLKYDRFKQYTHNVD